MDHSLSPQPGDIWAERRANGVVYLVCSALGDVRPASAIPPGQLAQVTETLLSLLPREEKAPIVKRIAKRYKQERKDARRARRELSHV